MADAPEIAIGRHRDCTWATERDNGDGCIFCWFHKRKFVADEVTKCSDFRMPRLRVRLSRAEVHYGRLKGSRSAVVRVGK